MSKGFTHESSHNETKEWYTPPDIFLKIGIEFDLDPCAPPDKIIPWIPAKKRFSVLENGLTQKWGGSVWLNPPYGADTPKWLERLAEHKNGIALVFARTDTNWFNKYATQANVICFVKGRICFMKHDLTPGGMPGCGSMLLGYGDKCADALIRSNLGPCYEKREI